MSGAQPTGNDGSGESADPRDLRCSDAEREVVAEAVRQAAGDGRLTLEEKKGGGEGREVWVEIEGR